ncbi:hypothetical protein HanOQP8_Chr01g0004151 [Helianthus annuus]|nr:hypothetical protein HanOQP8_Chr01g0004151 [Helianthus annuus]
MTMVTRRSGGFRPATWSRWRHYGGLWRWFGDERLWGAVGVMVIGSEPKGGGRCSDDGEDGVDEGVDLGGGSRRIRVLEVPPAPRVQQESRSKKNSSPMGSKRHSRMTDSGGDGELCFRRRRFRQRCFPMTMKMTENREPRKGSSFISIISIFYKPFNPN